jgi:serine/threonine protein kinase/tetratricopeptide (TPR) repeat protein
MTKKDSIFGVEPEGLRQLIRSGMDIEEEAHAGEQPPASGCVSGLMERPGTRIGCYKLLKQLGEGGMGMVYLAEQEQLIRRRVALKIIKPGMDSKRVLARFEAERQALALLDHPNIAQVYDAGTADSGRPYFVMEYVKGTPITEFCDRHTLSIEQRLRLFQQVCQAVHHAHQKGIIHRDIKPSNILVTSENDQVIPKIIDFGVAKAVVQPLTERTLITEDSQLLGTPEYMSPEQVEFANEDIDTRSDIYSLGVLLYELLTGVLPFDSETLRKGGMENIRKMIRETDPRTPSTRLTRLGDKATEIAQNRRMEIRTLAKHLRNELEWIPLKAMRKERSERYKSASELSDDIDNFLKGAPLMAGPLTAGYRLKKFIRRHKALVGGITAVLIVSIIGTIVSVSFALGQARALAKAELIAHYLEHDVLNAFARQRAREVTAHDILQIMSENLEVKFKDYPLVEASIRDSLGFIYNWGLNDYKVAEMHMERARRLYRDHLGEERSSNTLGSIYNRLGKYKEAEAVYNRRLDSARSRGRDELDLTFSKCNLACVYYNQGRYKEAEDLFLETWDIAEKGNRLGWVQNYECPLAKVYLAQGKEDEAERLYMAGISRAKAKGQSNTYHESELGHLRTLQGRYEDANDLLVKACEMARKGWGKEHPRALDVIHNLAFLRREQGQYEQAEALFLEVLTNRRKRLDEDHPSILRTKNDLAVLYAKQGVYDKAEPLFLEAVDGRRLKLGRPHPHTIESMNNLIDLYEAWNKPEKANSWRTRLPQSAP